MNTKGEHAVILGGSMAGLLAARVVAEHYERVTVIDRDALPPGAYPRKGVAQSRQAHILLTSGAYALEELFPGFLDGLQAAGVPVMVDGAEQIVRISGHRMRTVGPMPHRVYQASRPLLEDAVRARVRALPNVSIRDRCDVAGLTANERGDRVTGVRLLDHERGSAEEFLHAHLVIDATGRTGRAAVWLEELGYPAPRVEELTVGLKYASRWMRLKPGALGRTSLVLDGPYPGRPRGMITLAQENDRWRVLLFGYEGHHPPTDADGYLEFLRSVAQPHVYRALAGAEPLDDPIAHRFQSNLRRHYERLRRFPRELLVIGDALCSFNPLYAQGMSVAAQEALVLRRCLRGGERDLARRYFRGARRVVDVAWQLAVGGDLAIPEVHGRRPVSVRILNAYLGRLQQAAEHDGDLALRFLLVTSLLSHPATLLTPRMLWRVLATRREPQMEPERAPESVAG